MSIPFPIMSASQEAFDSRVASMPDPRTVTMLFIVGSNIKNLNLNSLSVLSQMNNLVNLQFNFM